MTGWGAPALQPPSLISHVINGCSVKKVASHCTNMTTPCSAHLLNIREHLMRMWCEHVQRTSVFHPHAEWTKRRKGERVLPTWFVKWARGHQFLIHPPPTNAIMSIRDLSRVIGHNREGWMHYYWVHQFEYILKYGWMPGFTCEAKKNAGTGESGKSMHPTWCSRRGLGSLAQLLIPRDRNPGLLEDAAASLVN